MILTTGRTLNQGKYMLDGKSSEEYLKEISTCQLDQEDLFELNLKDEDTISIISNYGSAIARVKKSKYAQKGIAFMPLGIVANMLIRPETDATGMPTLKNIPIEISKTDQNKYNEFISNLKKEFRWKNT